LKPCRFATFDSKVLCGKFEVFEDQAKRAGRKITLHIVVLPALDFKPAPDPVFFLSGGPGQGAAKIASAGEDNLMSKLRRERDLVFVDQRGTGDSHPLNCDLSSNQTAVQRYFDDLFPADKVRSCRAALEAGADLKLYTTAIAMGDLDEVRAALGYEKINLYGVSYGTLAALQYLRQFPNQARTLAWLAWRRRPRKCLCTLLKARRPLWKNCSATAQPRKVVGRSFQICRKILPRCSPRWTTVQWHS
jgi:hypothetical protein